MIHYNVQQSHDILVAASIAKQSGFRETEAALRKIAKCAACDDAPKCSGLICNFRPENIEMVQRH